VTHWHVTNRRVANAILAEGLRTDADGWNSGYVWLFDDLSVALRSAADNWGGDRGDNVVFAVDTTGYALAPDHHPGFGDDRDRHAFTVPHSIPADRVRLLSPNALTAHPS
jgi:hypothetical protein